MTYIRQYFVNLDDEQLKSIKEKAEKWDEFESRMKPGLTIFPTTQDFQFTITKLEVENKQLKEIVERLEKKYEEFGDLLIRDMTIQSWTSGQVCSLLEYIHGNLTNEGN